MTDEDSYSFSVHSAYRILCDHGLLFGSYSRMNRKFGPKAQEKVERALHEMNRGSLKSGRNGKTVTSRKQAIAIGLSEARNAGAKVPRERK
jgi:hypothetical protein